MNLSINNSIELLGMNVTVNNPKETIKEASRLSAKVLAESLDPDSEGVCINEMEQALLLSRQVFAMLNSDSN